MGYEANRFVETSARTFAVIEHLSREGTVGVSELARDLEMSKGIVHNHLSTLRELGYVTKVDEKYRLSPKFLSLGHQARTHSEVYKVVRSELEQLAQQFNTTAVLAQATETTMIVIQASRMPPGPEIEVGQQQPLWSSVIGMVLLAYHPEEKQTVISDAQEQNSEYDIESALRQLSDQGYLIGPMTVSRSARGVAIPALDETGECHGAIGTYLPKSENEDQVIQELLSLQDRLQRRLGSEWETNRSFATEKHAWFSG